MPGTRDILSRLIAFPTVSRTPNDELVGYVRSLLEPAGVACELVESDDGRNLNLFAHHGSTDRAGILLSGHTDVVPVSGQAWTVEPFRLTESDGRLYGRGAADMKGFVACAIRAMLKAAALELRTPLQLALSYDEEIGCVGVRRLLDMLEHAPFTSAMCIVGEPTGLVVATGHKGKVACRALCRGREAHSALAPAGLNAIHLASDFVSALRAEQDQLVARGARDEDYDVPYSTVHVGLIEGGTALNIVPSRCSIDFEIRHLAEDDPDEILARLATQAASIAAQHRDRFAESGIELTVVNRYPGLATPPEEEVVAFVKSLTGGNSTCKVAFGTEGGLISRQLGSPTVVCGPGSMDQGHKPDEYVTVEQLQRCDAMLDALITRLSR